MSLILTPRYEANLCCGFTNTIVSVTHTHTKVRGQPPLWLYSYHSKASLTLTPRYEANLALFTLFHWDYGFREGPVWDFAFAQDANNTEVDYGQVGEWQ